MMPEMSEWWFNDINIFLHAWRQDEWHLYQKKALSITADDGVAIHPAAPTSYTQLMPWFTKSSQASYMASLVRHTTEMKSHDKVGRG